MFKKTAALLLSLCLFTNCFILPAPALGNLPDFTVTKEDWDANWDSTGNVNTNVCLTPGRNETELNFAWHAGLNPGTPAVAISDSRAMAKPVVFTGSFTPADDGFVTCRVTAAGLKPDTAYYYTYGNGDLTYGPYMYRTLGSDTFKFLYVNDIHQGYDANNIAYGRDMSYWNTCRFAAIFNRNPDISFMLSGGDTIRSGYLSGEWNALLASPVFRSLPAAFAVGNHDKTGDMMKNYVNNPNEFNAMLPSPTGKDYWFRYGKALFLVFDSTNGNAADHMAFAKDAVNKNLDAQWRIGLLHHDLYTPIYPVLLPVQAVFSPVIDMAGLDILLEGHSHIFGRSHFMNNGRIANLGFGKEITDPKGTAYISMNAFQNDSASVTRFPLQNIWTAKRDTKAAVEYAVFEVIDGKLIYKAYSPEGTLEDEYTINKTAAPAPFKEPENKPFFGLVKLIGFIYALIDYNVN